MRTIAAVILFGTAAASQQPSLTEVLSRVAAYAAQFDEKLIGVAAEERSDQRLRAPEAETPSALGLGSASVALPANDKRRVVRSDFVLARTSAGGWIAYRDAFEVDGKSIRERQDRLSPLLVNATEATLTQATRLADESSRHNLGDLKRTINIPMFAITLMRAEHAKQFEFRQAGRDRIGGRDVWRIDLKETGRPTVVRTTQGDLPVTGSVWADPMTGTVMRTMIRATDGRLKATVTVNFQQDPKLGLWVPAEMEESYQDDVLGELRAKASYTNYTGVIR